MPLLEGAFFTQPDLLISLQCDTIVAFFNFVHLLRLIITKLVPVSVFKTSDLCCDGLLVSSEILVDRALSHNDSIKHVLDRQHIVVASLHGGDAFENMILFGPVDLVGIQCRVLLF